MSGFAGLSLGVDVHQFPSDIFTTAGANVWLFCSHKKADYRVILWYQQTDGDTALKLIGYGYGEFRNDSVEEPYRKYFKLVGDLNAAKKNVSLSITDVKASEHNARYFCAAREAHYNKHPQAVNKNLYLWLHLMFPLNVC